MVYMYQLFSNCLYVEFALKLICMHTYVRMYVQEDGKFLLHYVVLYSSLVPRLQQRTVYMLLHQ